MAEIIPINPGPTWVEAWGEWAVAMLNEDTDLKQMKHLLFVGFAGLLESLKQHDDNIEGIIEVLQSWQNRSQA